MIFQLLLVTCLFLSAVIGTPVYNPPLNTGEKPEETPVSLTPETNPLRLNNAGMGSSEERDLKDLTPQEAFYPVGGVWWGVRPGGWGGYRPWYGWHGWHRPHWGGNWGGHWGGNWGGPWGGSTWGRTNS